MCGIYVAIICSGCWMELLCILTCFLISYLIFIYSILQAEGYNPLGQAWSKVYITENVVLIMSSYFASKIKVLITHLQSISHTNICFFFLNSALIPTYVEHLKLFQPYLGGIYGRGKKLTQRVTKNTVKPCLMVLWSQNCRS